MTARHRDQRGFVFPSPVVMLSIIAVAMAGIAFVATRGGEPTEREITTISQRETPVATPSASAAEPSKEPKPAKPPVKRSEVYVEVYNNSGITGLAGSVADQAGQAGWQVVGSDNWVGTIPATTVYFPPRLERAAKLLALDLGVERVVPAVDPMRLDRLTIILTAPLD
ncbi:MULTISPECIES: LytR C-terminal domain-containing protein [unclassified Nocardioides]|uniref:LytR C-terminal domain-containing protein n=1 Tax=unclassified Nocardioides TaxID=2615069 RepID=UPI0026663A02|nr:LytR C-terminal domain-containing protein [Nocardioides sp. Arc9.136]WKN47954.1 LytR C-terminal domain-containing protein [Nocardioides sp. Arc9.136]